MKSTRRAQRRHHRERLQARAESLFSAAHYKNDPEMLAAMREWARRNHDHLAACSCWMCGNIRKWHGPSLQERRLLDAAKREASEANDALA